MYWPTWSICLSCSALSFGLLHLLHLHLIIIIIIIACAWTKNIHDDLSSLDLGILGLYEARDPAQNRSVRLGSNFIASICCGLVLQLVARQVERQQQNIRNKSATDPQQIELMEFELYGSLSVDFGGTQERRRPGELNKICELWLVHTADEQVAKLSSLVASASDRRWCNSSQKQSAPVSNWAGAAR